MGFVVGCPHVRFSGFDLVVLMISIHELLWRYMIG